MIMTKIEFIEHAKGIFKLAKESLQKNGKIMPELLAFTPETQISIPCEWQTTEDKYRFSKKVSTFLALKNCYAYLFISEVWMSKTVNINNPVPPSAAPDKTEAIIVAGEMKSGERFSAVVEFKKTADEKIVFENELISENKQDMSLGTKMWDGIFGKETVQ